MYDVICPQCGISEDVLFSNPDDRCCPHCGNSVVCPPVIVGLKVDGPIVSKQLGRTFKNTAEKNAYLRANNIKEFGKGDSDDQRIGFHSENRANEIARKNGYNDLEHRNKTVKAEQAKGWTPKAN